MSTVDGLDVDVDWGDYDPAEWRNHPEPPDHDLDDDEDQPTPADVISVSGVDPDEEGW